MRVIHGLLGALLGAAVGGVLVPWLLRGSTIDGETLVMWGNIGGAFLFAFLAMWLLHRLWQRVQEWFEGL